MSRDILKEAEQALEQAEQQRPATPEAPRPIEAASQQITISPEAEHFRSGPGSHVALYRPQVPDIPPPPLPGSGQGGTGEIFQDMPQQIREPGERVNAYDAKRYNLAAAMETLERATQTHQALPSADNAFAVASLSELILKLTRDLEKSQDPREVYDVVMAEVVDVYGRLVVEGVAREMAWIRDQAQSSLMESRRESFKSLIKEATDRIVPGVKKAREHAGMSLLKTLGIKKPPRGSG